MKTHNWNIEIIEDLDGHLNVYITTNNPKDKIIEIDTSQGEGIEEQLALRFTTEELEKVYDESL